MKTETLDVVLPICKLLLDEDRLKIVGHLAQQATGLDTLTTALRCKPQSLSKHLARLTDSGLVQLTPAGEYRLDVKTLHQMKRTVFTLTEDPPPPPSNEKERVFRSFLEGERLKAIPEKRPKLVVILAWLVEKFEPEKRYPEKEVNQIIQNHHPDYASLRRFLVDFGFMRREKGIYWRI